MKETEEIMGMIKEEGAAYFARERGNKVEVGLYLEHIILLKDDISYVSSFEEATGMTRSIENIDESHSTGPCPIGD